VFTDGRQQAQYVVVLWLGCRCLPSVNTICCRIMIGLSLLLSVSKHNMWSYYDWVVVVRPHNVFTYGRQQRQPNHNTTTYCVYWRKTTTTQSKYHHILCLLMDEKNDNPVVVLGLGCRCCRPSVNIICGRIMIGLSLSSVSKHNMWSYYDWVVDVFRQ
jgi:hypothetical protein